MNNRKGFTLIELMIVIAIIAIIAAIAIPGILSARRSANAGSALANLKSFSTAMATYAQDQANQSYPQNENVLGDYYSHISNKGGYVYTYTCNWASPLASKFVYYTVPSSLNNGTKAFFVDESNRIFECTLTTTPTLGVDFANDGTGRVTGGPAWNSKS